MKSYVKFFVVLIAVAISVSLVMNWPLGFVALALFVGWPVVGIIVTIDDDLPGGWNNPDGKAIPEWKTLEWHIDILLCRGSIVVLAFAFQLRSDAMLSGILLIVALAMGIIGFPYISKLFREREVNYHATAENG